MGALLDPTTKRLVITAAQETRTLYHYLKVVGVLVQTYRSIYLILAKAMLKKIEDGKWIAVKNDDDPQTKRKTRYSKRHKLVLGKAIEEMFKTAFERLSQDLGRIDTSDYEKELDKAEDEEATDILLTNGSFDECSQISNSIYSKY